MPSFLDSLKGVASPFDVFGIFDRGKNPADLANQEFAKAIPLEKGYYDPFMQQGAAAYQNISPIYRQMTESPQDYLGNLMKSYSPSQYYQSQRDKGAAALANSAAAGGMRGSVADVEGQTNLTNSLLNQDMQNWLKNALGYQNLGLQGQQHIYDTGYEATKGLTGDISNILGTQEQLAFQGQREKQRQNQDLISSLFGAAGGIFGGMYGGPMGAAAGSSIGSGAGRGVGGWMT